LLLGYFRLIGGYKPLHVTGDLKKLS